MSRNPFDSQEVLRVLEGSLSRESAAQPQLKNPVEGISVFTHALLLSIGFRLVGLSDDDNLETPISSEALHHLPSTWNSHSGIYTFRYAHSQSAMQYLIRITRMGNKTVFTALGMGDDKPATFDIVTDHYMSPSFFPYSVPSSSDIASPGSNKLLDGFISESRLNDLANLVRTSLVQRLVPGLMKEEAAAFGAGRGDRAAQEDARTQEERRPRLLEEVEEPRVPRPGFGFGQQQQPIPEGLRPPGWEDEYEVLSGPRGGYGGSFPGGRNPLSIGADDLNPPGLGPNPPMRGPFFGEGGVGAGGGMGGMGGMHPGPDHPMFGGGQGPQNPRAPPGARYDQVFPGDYPPQGGLRGPRGPFGGAPGGGSFGGSGGFGGAPPNPFGGFGGGDFI